MTLRAWRHVDPTCLAGVTRYVQSESLKARRCSFEAALTPRLQVRHLGTAVRGRFSKDETMFMDTNFPAGAARRARRMRKLLALFERDEIEGRR